MRVFLKLISYIFHPLFIPIAGTLIYFTLTPKYSPLELQSGNILPIFILTVIIPIISFFILRNVGLVSTVFMPEIRERKYAFYISISLLLLILIKVIPNNYIPELYNFFLGLLSATFASLLLLFFKFRSSMHLMGMASILMYVISLSIHFEINVTIAIAIITLITGLVATSRIYLNAHTKPEILVGFFLGLISQLLTIKFWL
ncbi:membrane-associated phospholipid phosphatase [Saonia flava]|uniref:Membrane-associated phospholipid phosphatase n=1 Tax=Saonia flava TaxID=523696 RepID=A0A846QUV7_9FLAO|nr:phosphatase PAP2 family protein [Saonia flava]NJB70997.1 membrane-associated phospholipid phosphatase [Saonia flava]